MVVGIHGPELLAIPVHVELPDQVASGREVSDEGIRHDASDLKLSSKGLGPFFLVFKCCLDHVCIVAHLGSADPLAHLREGSDAHQMRERGQSVLFVDEALEQLLLSFNHEDSLHP